MIRQYNGPKQRKMPQRIVVDGIAIMGTETEEQIMYFEHVKRMKEYFKEYNNIFHVVNENGEGERRGRNLNKLGRMKGVPDIFVDIPAGIYHGLRIELKVADGQVSQEQREWLERLNAQGYKAIVCVGYKEAIEATETYLKLNQGEKMVFKSNFPFSLKWKTKKVPLGTIDEED